MPLSFASAELVGLFLELILYGIYVALFAGCVKVLYNKRRRGEGGNHRLILALAVLFVLITWHQVVDALRIYLGYHGGQADQGADVYFLNVTAMLCVMKTAVYLAMTVLSDLFILYRCYIVWNASIPIITLPVLLYLADIGTGVAAVYTLTLIGDDVVFNLEQQRITNAFFSCTLALNAVCTGLIAFRIWRAQQQTRGSNLMHVSVIVIESGAIYLSVLACVVASYNLESLLFFIFLDITSPVIGIVFSLIIIRISIGASSKKTCPSGPSLSYSMPSKTVTGNMSRSNGPIVFRSMTTTQFTDGQESETTFKPSESQGGTYKTELRGDGDSSIDISA
ncbi:hypothetical protein BC826DRAFT_64231 [Russula brevipes]|nr:hypothetical protein BC826DRAFT_64231 [Russula brevipes]